MSLFSNKQESNLRSCIDMIEEVIASLGHAVDETRIETFDEWPGWCIRKGTARVFVLLQGRGEENFLRVVAPVLEIDEGTKTLELFRRLLELNAKEIYGAAFALRGNEIVLTAERSTLDLDRSEVLDLVERVQAYADHYDDALASELGGKLARVQDVRLFKQ
ncbi:MAG: YbjN domain-containing protein [Deltaproteobacteria bacterium]|nr:YbjN domain-containing protein [Deltaproteobacteria bacterium]